MSQIIIATKDGITKKFSKISWNALGANKHGWVSSTTFENSVSASPSTPPPTGEKIEPAKHQIVENQVADLKTNEPTIENQVVESEKAPVVSEEFATIVKSKLTKNNIKDYFDEKNISYKASASMTQMIEQLATTLENSVDKLKNEFSITESEL